MSLFLASFQCASILMWAYVLSYPLEWVIYIPCAWLWNRFESYSAWITDMNEKMDADPNFLPWNKDSK